MPTKKWNVKYKDHQLEVENYWSLGLIWNKHRARLFIDGVTADEHSDKGFFLAGQGSTETTLRGQVVNKDRTSVVRVTIRAKAFGTSCAIRIDDETIFED